MTITHNDNVEILGSDPDIAQLRVQGASNLNAPLQAWQDSASTTLAQVDAAGRLQATALKAQDNLGTTLAQVTDDGRLQVGDDLGLASPDSLIEAHRDDTSVNKPQRGVHTLGRIAGALTDAVQWAVSELELLGTGGVSGLHSTLRAGLTHSNDGDSSAAELRAGDFEAVNQSGSAGTPVGQITGVHAAATNQDDAYVTKAVALEAAAAAIGQTALAELPEPVEFASAAGSSLPPLLKGMRIGVARDTAFAFLYPANLELLHTLGAELSYFSPLKDTALPEVDSIYLPGGYPELYLEPLAGNTALRQAFYQHHQRGKPIYAECGGMLYLLETLTDQQGNQAEMLGLLPGHAVMQPRLAALGLQSVRLPEGELRGHTFHHSRMETELIPLAYGRRQRKGEVGEAVYRIGRLTASYLHLYFPTNPQAVASLFLP
jgi:hypothetical protein